MAIRYSHPKGEHVQAAMDKLKKRLNLALKSLDVDNPGSITQELHKDNNHRITKAD